jgi:hypothetical protein
VSSAQVLGSCYKGLGFVTGLDDAGWEPKGLFDRISRKPDAFIAQSDRRDQVPVCQIEDVPT